MPHNWLADKLLRCPECGSAPLANWCCQNDLCFHSEQSRRARFSYRRKLHQLMADENGVLPDAALDISLLPDSVDEGLITRDWYMIAARTASNTTQNWK